MKEFTVVLPPGEERELDCSEVSKLLRKAVYRTLNGLKNLSLPKILRGVHQPKGESITYNEIQSIDYGNEKIWEDISKIWRSEETLALTEYIWDHGACKTTFTGPSPDRKSWERKVFMDLVEHPLFIALETTQRERLMDFGKIEAWEVDPNKVEKAIQEAVDFYCRKKHLLTAICPLARLNLPAGLSIELASDIWLRCMTTRDVCLLLSRHSHEYHWEYFKHPATVSDVAEICFPIETGKKHDLPALIQDRLDLLKWALFVALGMDKPVAEGTCVIKGGLDARLGIFRRDENMTYTYRIDEQAIERCKKLIMSFREFSESRDDLLSALWHFGRACVAILSRDILLESAIGLDLLFVPSEPGDSRYRFCLHGAAILSSNPNDGKNLFNDLKKIYDNRSKAAHGHKVRAIDELALSARKKLAQAIFKIVNLLANKMIDACLEIGKGVQQYILKKATSYP